MGSYAKKLVCLSKMGVILVVLLLLFACTEDIQSPLQKSKPTEYQSASLNGDKKFARAVRLEGAWASPVNITNIRVTDDAGGEVQGPEILNASQGNFIGAYTLSTERNPQTGTYVRVESHVVSTKIGDIAWSEVLPPEFPPLTTGSSEKKLLSYKRNHTNEEILSLWYYGGVVYLASFNSINGWQKNIPVSRASVADLKVLDDGSVIVWLPDSNAEDGLILNHYLASLYLLSSTAAPSLPFKFTKFAETQRGLLAVWYTTANDISEMKSEEYDWVQSWQPVTKLKSLNANVSSIELFENKSGNTIELIYILTGIDHSIYSISHGAAGWGMEVRLDDTLQGTKMVSSDVSFYADKNNAALAWVAQSEAQPGQIQKIVVTEFSGVSGWTIPKTVSNDVIVDDGASLSQLEIVVSSNKKMLSWVESGPGRNELFGSHSSGAVWGQPELIHSVAGSNNSINHSAVSYDAADNVIVSWQQTENRILEKNISLWSSIPLVQGGVAQGRIVQPPADVSPVTTDPSSIGPGIQAAHWTAPQQAWSLSFLGNLEHHIYGPDLYLKNGNDAFLSIHRAVGYDPTINDYKNMRSHVLHKTANDTWIEALPFSAGTVDTTFVEIQQVHNTGNAYALWTQNGLLYFNNYVAGQGWQTEQPLGYETYHYHLLVDSNNNGYLFWITGGVINLAQYIPGTGIQPVESFPTMDVLFYADPVMRSDNSIYLSWIGFPSFGTTPYIPSNLLHLIRFQQGVGWGEINTAPMIESSGFLGNRVDAKLLPNNELLVVTRDTVGQIYSNTYSDSTGWGAWQNVDYNLDLYDNVMARPSIATNSNHDIMLTWAESTKDELGETIYRVYSNQYNVTPDANGTNWPFPQRIASMPPLNNNNNWHVEIHPQIAMSATGRAVAVWIDEDAITSSLVANEYVPGTGWGLTPDVIASYTIGVDGKIDAPQVAIADDNSTIISWRQKSRSEFSVDYRVWSVELQATDGAQ